MVDRVGRLGHRRLALIAATVSAVAIISIGLWFALQRDDRMLGSNAVGVGSPIAGINPGDEFCINAVDVPPGTERLRLWLGLTVPDTKLLLSVEAPGRERVTAAPFTVSYAGVHRFVPLPSLDWPATEIARVCIESRDGGILVGGAFVDRLPDERPATMNGKPLGDPEPSVGYYSGANDRPVNLFKLTDIFSHMKVFHGWFYPWLAALLLTLTLVATMYGLLTVAHAEDLSVKRLALVFMAISFLWGLSWAVISPPFQGNDESEHFANLQYLAETGDTWTQSYLYSKAPSYSKHEQRMMQAVHHRGVVVDGSARPFWSENRGKQYKIHDNDLPRGDGGGYTISASGHGPAYYSLFAIPYRLTTWMQPANQLVFLRALNALLFAVVGLFAVLTAAMVFQGRKMPAAAAGSVAATQPMAGYSAGSINNDTAVIVAGAIVLWLLVKLATDGWSRRHEIALGFVAVAGPVAKLTATSVSLFSAFWVLMMLLRDRTLGAVRGAATVGAATLASCVAYLAMASAFGWPARLTNVHTDAGVPNPDSVPTLFERFDYFVQTVFPAIQLTGDHQMVSKPFGRIYVVGGWADFMWHRIAFPENFYKPIAVILAVILLIGLVALVRHRRWLRVNWMPVAMVATLPVAVIALVAWAYATPGGRPVLAEQGRYILPALTALCVAGAGAMFGLPAHLRALGWGAYSGLVGGFTVVCMGYALFHLYA